MRSYSVVSWGNSIKNGTTLTIPSKSQITANDAKKSAAFPILKVAFHTLILINLFRSIDKIKQFYVIIFSLLWEDWNNLKSVPTLRFRYQKCYSNNTVKE